jgi:hypothetical protein
MEIIRLVFRKAHFDVLRIIETWKYLTKHGSKWFGEDRLTVIFYVKIRYSLLQFPMRDPFRLVLVRFRAFA